MINAQMQFLLDILDKSPWQGLEKIIEKQQKHIQQLIDHARQTVPLYQELYASQLENNLENLPILTREHIQNAGEKHISSAIPKSHGNCYSKETSGSTGNPVKILLTDFTRLFFNALHLREHHWHQRDYSKALMAIKWAKKGIGMGPIGLVHSTWGQPIEEYKQTAMSIFINVMSDSRSQIDAILYYHPSYLSTYPSQAAALAEYSLNHHIHIPFLEEIRLTGETLQDDYISIIKQAWPQVKITDVYSSEEIGYIAQQCPEFQNYHVNCESVYLEIVDERNEACQIGQPGKILITSLLNYATPLIRYDIGDYGIWGKPCTCGRGSPVIQKVLGRKRNRIYLPNGESIFPYLGEREDSAKIISGIRKFQFVQHSVHDIEIKLILKSPLTTQQEIAYKKLRQHQLGYPFNITLSYPEDIPLSPTGKYEEFISYVSKI